MKRRKKENGANAAVRPWTFEEVPLGAVIEYEDRGWSGKKLCHSIISEVSKSGSEVEVSFGSEKATAAKLAGGDYNIVRDGFKFACGVIDKEHNVLTPMEKFRVAKAFASIIAAAHSFTEEFSGDTLVVEEWLDSLTKHKVLLSNTGMLKAVWLADVESDPEMSLQEMCDSSCVATAYEYVLGRLGLLSRIHTSLSVSMPTLGLGRPTL